MAITLVGVGPQVTDTSTPLTITLPAGVAENDLLILILCSREDNPQPVFTPPGGWTRRGSGSFQDLGNTGLALEVWYKFASPAEAAPEVAVNDASP
ncbi:unnamed protein product, partial [marine sediment metagenome]